MILGTFLGDFVAHFWAYRPISEIESKKPQKWPFWEIAYFFPKMSLWMVPMALYGKKNYFLGISSLKMDIFYIQSCIWPKTPIFDLRASSGRRANAPVEISNFFFVIGTQWSKIIRKNQWKDPFLLKKCLKNQIFWIFGFSKLQISMKISTHWPGMATLVYFLCFLNLCKLVGNKNNALGYRFWPKIDSDRAKFDPNYC